MIALYREDDFLLSYSNNGIACVVKVLKLLHNKF